MGLGIGKYCKLCDKQLDLEVGFNDNETICKLCIKKGQNITNVLGRILLELGGGTE